jgi:hypothetical protein
MLKKPAKSKAAKPAKSKPQPERFKIVGMSWEDAVSKAMSKKKPAGGWPK